jgi:nucleotide-binding universal stress UspA family protein
MPDRTDSDENPNLHILVGYDGSPPADRALEAAVRLLQGRSGDIHVSYVAHVPSVDLMSADAIVEVEEGFDEIEKDLRASAAALLDGRRITWKFQRRQGQIVQELIAAASAVTENHPGDTVAIVVGSSSSASHRIIGSVAVGLARHCHVPVMIVP